MVDYIRQDTNDDGDPSMFRSMQDSSSSYNNQMYNRSYDCSSISQELSRSHDDVEPSKFSGLHSDSLFRKYYRLTKSPFESVTAERTNSRIRQKCLIPNLHVLFFYIYRFFFHFAHFLHPRYLLLIPTKRQTQCFFSVLGVVEKRSLYFFEKYLFTILLQLT